jgi:hypothetical protein
VCVPFGSLWLPVVVSTVVVFFASFALHMLLPLHKKEYGRLPEEDAVMSALAKQPTPEGQYMFPHCGKMEDFKKPEFKARWEAGPAGILVIRPRGPYNMGKSLLQWTINVFVTSLLIGYVARHVLTPTTPHLEVLRLTSTIGFLAYVMATWTESIWKARPWSSTLLTAFDGLIYALLTGATFCLLWPKG